MTDNKEIIVLDDESDNDIEIIQPNNSGNIDSNNNHNKANVDSVKYINNNNSNKSNSSLNKNNNIETFNKHSNSRANINNTKFQNTFRNVTKSNTTKYNSEQRRQFLADIHEKRLGIGKSIQCIEIDDDFFRDDNDLNDVNNKYTIKEEFNNNSNDINSPKSKTKITKTTPLNTNTNINNNKTLVNNKNSNMQPFDYQASLKLRKEIESIRNSKHQNYRDNKLEQKKIFNLNDIEQLRKQEEKEKMVMASMETTIRSNNRSVHTIDNTLLHPEAIGRKALELTNSFRRSKNLPPLVWNQSIYLIGVEHSKNMGDKVVEFGHDGFKERVKKFPFKFKSVGENVAYTNSSDVSENAVDGWINSPGHRKNLLGNFNVCSIGVYKNSEGFWYLTQLFALQSI